MLAAAGQEDAAGGSPAGEPQDAFDLSSLFGGQQQPDDDFFFAEDLDQPAPALLPHVPAGEEAKYFLGAGAPRSCISTAPRPFSPQPSSP